jgi:hypothetical protein
MRQIISGLLLLSAATSVVAQNRVYYGTWKINSAKSNMAAFTMALKDAGEGRVEMSEMAQDEVVTVGRDGKEYPALHGITVSWRDLGDASFETVARRDGTVVTTQKYTLSADGGTLTQEVTNTPPGAKPVKARNTYTRTSGGPGFFGSWKPSAVEGRLEILPSRGGVRFAWVEVGVFAQCQFDGSDCPLEGSAAVGSAMTLRETGPRSFEYQDKTNGKTNYTSKFSVAEDGKTLTEDQTMANGQKLLFVYDKQ